MLVKIGINAKYQFHQHCVPTGRELCCGSVFYQDSVPNGTESFDYSPRLQTPTQKGEIIRKKIRQNKRRNRYYKGFVVSSEGFVVSSEGFVVSSEGFVVY
jgi:hypothetical protein